MHLVKIRDYYYNLDQVREIEVALENPEITDSPEVTLHFTDMDLVTVTGTDAQDLLVYLDQIRVRLARPQPPSQKE